MTEHEGAKGGGESQEIEWQYDVPGGLEKVEEWLSSRDPTRFRLKILGGSVKELIDTYYDAEDWRLFRAGYALRIRREEGSGSEATMKSLISAAEDNLHRRLEVSEPFEAGEINDLLRAPGPVGERLRALLGPRKLRPIFEIRTRRQTFDLVLDKQSEKETQTCGSAARVGEVALDDSEIPLGGRSVRLTRVEVELDTSATTAPSKLEGFVKAMENALELRPAMVSKYEIGLAATGQRPNEAWGRSTKKE